MAANPDIAIGHVTTYYVSTVTRCSVRMMRPAADSWMVTIRRQRAVSAAHFSTREHADAFARGYASMMRHDDGVITLWEMLTM